MQTSRVMTLEVVLGSRQGLFLPEGHPLLNTLDRLFVTFEVQGRITASSWSLALQVGVECSGGHLGR